MSNVMPERCVSEGTARRAVQTGSFRKLLCLSCIVLSLAAPLMLAGCDSLRGDAGNGPKQPLEELPGDYSSSDAIADGCLVIEDGNVANPEVLDQFIQNSDRQGKAFLRKFDCTNLDIDPTFDPEYYESVKDNYPRITVHDITYDDGLYSVRYYDEDGELTVRDFPYLEQQYVSPPNQYSAIESSTAYFLCERNDVLFQDILKGLLSDQFVAFPDFYIICLDNTYKDNLT